MKELYKMCKVDWKWEIHARRVVNYQRHCGCAFCMKTESPFSLEKCVRNESNVMWNSFHRKHQITGVGEGGVSKCLCFLLMIHLPSTRDSIHILTTLIYNREWVMPASQPMRRDGLDQRSPVVRISAFKASALDSPGLSLQKSRFFISRAWTSYLKADFIFKSLTRRYLYLDH